jgi:FkbM family methyltransferase
MLPVPPMSTANKLWIASLLSRAILGARSFSGAGPLARVKRYGITWCLDLREGIDLAIFLKVYERTSVSALDRLVAHGSVVLDIGANLGFYSLLLADRVGSHGRVIAFEPTRFAFTKLSDNLAANATLASRITTRRAMLVARSGEVAPPEVVSSWPLEGALGRGDGRLMSTEGAESITLDAALAELALERVDFIKLDVDGHETEVLLGGRQTLERFRPTMLFEVAPDYAQGVLASLIELLGDLGYGLESVTDGRPLPLSAEALARMCPRGGGMNVVARAVGTR